MRLIVLLFLSVFALTLRAENINVTFVVADTHKSYFYNLVNDVNLAVAKSLGINLEIIHSDSDRFAHVSAIRKIVFRDKKPDYIIFRGFLGNIAKMFDILEQQKIKFITLEQDFTGKDYQFLGTPQQNYKYWMGQINYDDKAGGELLLQALIDAHFVRYPNKKMSITGIGGNTNDQAKNRQSSLDNFNPEKYHNKIHVNQVFLSNWRATQVEKLFSNIYKRYPHTTAYWCAGDQLALSVLKKHQETANTPILIGGFDWIPRMLRKIKTGELTASVGGHFVMVADALVKIIDYENGLNRFILPPFRKQFELITQENIDLYLHSIENSIWNEIDFNDFVFSKNDEHIELTVNNMINLHQKNSAVKTNRE